MYLMAERTFGGNLTCPGVKRKALIYPGAMEMMTKWEGESVMIFRVFEDGGFARGKSEYKEKRQVVN